MMTPENVANSVTDIPDLLTPAIVEKFTMSTFNSFQTLTITLISPFKKRFWNSKNRYDEQLAHRKIQSSATKVKLHIIQNVAKDTLAKTHKKRSLFELSLYLTHPLAIHSDIEFAIKPATGKCMLRKICLQYNYVRIPRLKSNLYKLEFCIYWKI